MFSSAISVDIFEVTPLIWHSSVHDVESLDDIFTNRRNMIIFRVRGRYKCLLRFTQHTAVAPFRTTASFRPKWNVQIYYLIQLYLTILEKYLSKNMIREWSSSKYICSTNPADSFAYLHPGEHFNLPCSLLFEKRKKRTPFFQHYQYRKHSSTISEDRLNRKDNLIVIYCGSHNI